MQGQTRLNKNKKTKIYIFFKRVDMRNECYNDEYTVYSYSYYKAL